MPPFVVIPPNALLVVARTTLLLGPCLTRNGTDGCTSSTSTTATSTARCRPLGRRTGQCLSWTPRTTGGQGRARGVGALIGWMHMASLGWEGLACTWRGRVYSACVRLRALCGSTTCISHVLFSGAAFLARSSILYTCIYTYVYVCVCVFFNLSCTTWM